MTEQYLVQIPAIADKLERSFLEALQRIVDGNPISEACTKRVERGPVRPSQLVVAEEAGQSRTAISGDNCRLPGVQLEILRARTWFDQRRRTPTVAAGLENYSREAELERENRRLRRRNTDLVRQRDAAFTGIAASTMLTRALERSERLANPESKKARRAAEVVAV